ncbi:heme ABC exporter ATP-binding protein CcmA [Allosphingosinicella indica]|uniref:Heme exporter protein A n=1 Tax=Allosphingosinicella indica TaxID=941907 RepID=A0A1X7GHU3_9SPHN|nr:heme ABC exporter ATP-binding protein CcmA [Allosphingosinicella indica]SMF69943.1 heme exporter protein A [Allosphingosinicella indica]
MTGAGGLLRFERVACIRGGRLLFEGVDFALGEGEALVVRGPNGTGKSSLLRIAAGLLRAADGRVERGGAIALADENLALDAKRTLGRALGFWAALDGREAGAAMEAMGIARLTAVPVRMLSTGQRKRAALARVIASGAPLWLLDEPANGLDGDGLERLAAAMAAHRASGGAILAATHQPIGLDGAAELALA